MQLLGEVRIPSPKERYWDYPSKFSGGMMQRAMIVDAICAEPAVLIADNVTQPLDVTIAAQIVALLHDLCTRHKMATIYLSSSLPTLGQFGDRTAVLYRAISSSSRRSPNCWLRRNPTTRARQSRACRGCGKRRRGRWPAVRLKARSR